MASTHAQPTQESLPSTPKRQAQVSAQPTPPLSGATSKSITASELLATFSPRRTLLSPSHEKRMGQLLSPSSVQDELEETESSQGSDPSPGSDELHISNSPPHWSSQVLGHALSENVSAISTTIAAQHEDDSLVTRIGATLDLPETLVPQPMDPESVTRPTTREGLAQGQSQKQDNFLLHNRDFFLPLLPASNYISMVEARRNSTGPFNQVPYTRLEAQPSGIKGTLKDYQLSGLSFLAYLHDNGTSGILGDEMGLGKTLQTLALFQHLEEQQRLSAPMTSSDAARLYLVVCPVSVLGAWLAEAEKWAPDLRVLLFHGSQRKRVELKKILTRSMKGRVAPRRPENARKSSSAVQTQYSHAAEEDCTLRLIVTSYETVLSERTWFRRGFVWQYIVLDEGHRIKNQRSKLFAVLQGLKAKHRLILSGTPLQNNLLELWALLHWLYPPVFSKNTAELFETSFDLSKGTVKPPVIAAARRLLELICLRRLKDSPSVNINLPPKTEVFLYVPLTPMQRSWYMKLLTGTEDQLLDGIFRHSEENKHAMVDVDVPSTSLDVQGAFDTEVSAHPEWVGEHKVLHSTLEQKQRADAPRLVWQRLMNLVMQLRKVCAHPYLLEDATPDPYTVDDHVFLASGKFIVLRKLLQELVLQTGKKVLVFSGFTGVLDLAEDALALLGDGTLFKYARVDGSTTRARRNLAIRLFNTKPEYKVMLISTRAGGLGINLTSATEVIFVDQDWNPQITLQAEARAHRIGQLYPVTIYKLCTQGTVEEQMLGRIRKKLYLSTRVMSSMENVNVARREDVVGNFASSDEDMPELDASALKSLIRRGAEAIIHPTIDATEMLSWDFPSMLEKCRDRSTEPVANAGLDASEPEAVEQKWLSTMERVQCAVFEGKQFVRPKRVSEEPSSEQLVRADRRKDKNVTVVIDGFAVSKESMRCLEWEAVPTMSGKDPKLANMRRAQRIAPVNQKHCQVCRHGGDLHCCHDCPRAFHGSCLDNDAKASLLKPIFRCPQHYCAECHKGATDAGGLIYSCRWCSYGWCEDCINFEDVELLDDSFPEYIQIGFLPSPGTFYITCSSCYRQIPQDKAHAAPVESSISDMHQLSGPRMSATGHYPVRTQEQQAARTVTRPSTSGLDARLVSAPIPMAADGSSPSGPSKRKRDKDRAFDVCNTKPRI